MWQRPQGKGKDVVSRADIQYKDIKVATLFEFFKNIDKHMDQEMV